MVPRIKLVQIKNYKSLAAVSVQLEPFTVFVGPNGSGKSNFIDALSFLQDCVSESLELAVKKRGGMGVIICRLENIETIKAPPDHLSEHERQERLDRSVEAATKVALRLVFDIDQDLRGDYSLEIAMLPWGGAFIAHERCVLENGKGLRHTYEVRNGKFVQEIEGIDQMWYPDRLALFAAAATKTFRPAYDFLYSMRFYSIVPEKLRELQEPDAGDYLKRDGSNAAAVLRSLTKYSWPPEHRDRLMRLLGKVAEGITWVEEYPVGTKETLLFKQYIGLSQPENFAALSMSDGTLRALGLLLAVFQPSRPKVVGIEEPEATIHPAIMEMIMEVLIDASNERQVLVTTHSPEILDQKGLKDDQIRVMNWKKGRTLIARASHADRQAIRERLYTPGELLRIGELDPDMQEAERSGQEIDLFGEPFPGEVMEQ